MQHGELTTRDGRTLRWYDAGPTYAPLTLMWHHGTPNTGEPPAPLLEHFAAHGIRWIGFSRPAHPGSTRVAGRSVGDIAGDAIAVADHARVDQFAVWGTQAAGRTRSRPPQPIQTECSLPSVSRVSRPPTRRASTSSQA